MRRLVVRWVELGRLIPSLACGLASIDHPRAFAPVRLHSDQVLLRAQLDCSGPDLQQVSPIMPIPRSRRLMPSTLSYPLLILVVLGHVSNDDSALGLLKWRVLDGISGVVDRATVYIIINWGLTEVAR